jgi:hypothetical protein
MKEIIRIELKKDGDFHKDLFLNMPMINLSCEADSYYFLFAKSSGANVGYSKVVEILQHLLKAWLMRMDSLPITRICYLPFDFSDQYIGCLRIESVEQNKIQIQYGFTQKFMGMEISPAEINNFILQEDDFDQDSGVVVLDKDDFKKSIEESIAQIRDTEQ